MRTVGVARQQLAPQQLWCCLSFPAAVCKMYAAGTALACSNSRRRSFVRAICCTLLSSSLRDSRPASCSFSKELMAAFTPARSHDKQSSESTWKSSNCCLAAFTVHRLPRRCTLVQLAQGFRAHEQLVPGFNQIALRKPLMVYYDEGLDCSWRSFATGPVSTVAAVPPSVGDDDQWVVHQQR